MVAVIGYEISSAYQDRAVTRSPTDDREGQVWTGLARAAGNGRTEIVEFLSSLSS